MNVLITGGAGYIGSHCNKLFALKGIHTVVLDNLIFGHKEAVNWGKFIQGNFGDKNLVSSILKEYNIQAVIHFAAFADVADSVNNPSQYYINNVSNMIHMLDAMIENNVKYIVFSSSAAIFGEPEYIPIDEEHSKRPINPYGETKLIGEKLLRDYEIAYGLRYASLRYFNAAGADINADIGESHKPEHHVIPVIFETIKGKRECFYIFGNDYDTDDGTCIRDFVHVNDLAEAHYLALNYIMETGKSECFNLGNNTGYSVYELVACCGNFLGIKINYKFADRRQGDPAKLIADNKKTKALLNWNPKYSDLESIIQSAWKWEKNRKY